MLMALCMVGTNIIALILHISSCLALGNSVPRGNPLSLHLQVLFLLSPSRRLNLFNQCHFVLLRHVPRLLLPGAEYRYESTARCLILVLNSLR